MCEIIGKYIYNDLIFSFGQSMRKIIMIKEKKIFKTPL